MAKRREEKKPREFTKRQLSLHKRQERRQKIILFGGISIIVLIALIIFAGWFFAEYYPMQQTVATVYDTKIKQSEFIDAMAVIAIGQYSGGQQIDLTQYSDYILNQMVQTELAHRSAAELGVTVNEEEIEERIAGISYMDNDAGRAILYDSLLAVKLQEGYFADQVPDSANQVLINAMLVESEEIVADVQHLLDNGDNFSALAGFYAVNSASKSVDGVFDWHPEEILESIIGSSIPVDWAFSADAAPGDISNALSDNTSYKQVGYWLIRVTEMGDGEASVQALLLADKFEAEHVKSRLEAGDNLTALADEYTQQSRSKEGHGDMGLITETDNVSAAFSGYVFNPETPIGEWSDPIQDTDFWTRGGAWIVQVVDKEDDRALSDEDEKELIGKAYNNWKSSLIPDAGSNVVFNITDEQKQWAVEKANERISELLSG